MPSLAGTKPNFIKIGFGPQIHSFGSEICQTKWNPTQLRFTIRGIGLFWDFSDNKLGGVLHFPKKMKNVTFFKLVIVYPNVSTESKTTPVS